jgi:hypothetical protein
MVGEKAATDVSSELKEVRSIEEEEDEESRVPQRRMTGGSKIIWMCDAANILFCSGKYHILQCSAFLE